MKLAPATKETRAPWLDRIADVFRRPEHRPVRAAGEDPARHPQVAQSICRSAAHRRLRAAGAVAGLRPCRRSAGHARRQPMRRHQASLQADRTEIIWTEADIARIKKTCSAEIGRAVDLASHTGLAAWRLVAAVVVAHRRRRHRRHDRQEQAQARSHHPAVRRAEERAANIPKRSTTILTNSKGRPWARDGFGPCSTRRRSRRAWATPICTSMICAARLRPGSTSPACRSA